MRTAEETVMLTYFSSKRRLQHNFHRHVVIPGTPEHGTPEHPGTPRNTPEHPEQCENPEHPRTPSRKPGTPRNTF